MINPRIERDRETDGRIIRDRLYIWKGWRISGGRGILGFREMDGYDSLLRES